MFHGTSYDRFISRLADWGDNRRNNNLKPSTRIHQFWWIMHNCIAHPLIGFFPYKIFFKFHDFTSDKINGYR